MEILVAILIIALIAAVAFAVIQRRPTRNRDLGHTDRSPIGRRDRGVPPNDPMAAAVAEHARATDPADVVVAEERLRAQARQVAAPLQAEANRVEHQRAADQMGHGGAPYGGDPRMDGSDADGYAQPAYGDPRVDGNVDPARTDGYRDPATDPRYDDPRYDAPPAGDYGDPRPDDRRR